jgi:hypothetical protein
MRRQGGCIPLTLIACLTWLSNVVQFVKCVSGSQPFAPGELHPARKLRRAALRPRASLRHPLILDGFVHLRPSALTRGRLRQTSACTFYPVFKEPACHAAAPRDATPARLSGTSPPAFPSSGEPSNISSRPDRCQPLFDALSPSHNNFNSTTSLNNDTHQHPTAVRGGAIEGRAGSGYGSLKGAGRSRSVQQI